MITLISVLALGQWSYGSMFHADAPKPAVVAPIVQPVLPDVIKVIEAARHRDTFADLFVGDWFQMVTDPHERAFHKIGPAHYEFNRLNYEINPREPVRRVAPPVAKPGPVQPRTTPRATIPASPRAPVRTFLQPRAQACSTCGTRCGGGCNVGKSCGCGLCQ